MFLTAGALVVLSAVGFVLGETTTGGTGDVLGLSTLVAQIGLSAVFLWQWRSERDQRIKRDDQLIALMDRQGPVLAEAVETLRAVQASQRTFVAGSGVSMDRLVDELHKTQEALGEGIRKRD